MKYKKIEDGEIYWFVFENKVGRNNCPSYGKCLLEKCIACKVESGFYAKDVIFIKVKYREKDNLKKAIMRYTCTRYGTIIKEVPYVQSKGKPNSTKRI